MTAIRKAVDAGTVGKLIRRCMDLVRTQPEWKAIGGPVRYKSPQGPRWKQTVERKVPYLMIQEEAQDWLQQML